MTAPHRSPAMDILEGAELTGIIERCSGLARAVVLVASYIAPRQQEILFWMGCLGLGEANRDRLGRWGVQ